MTVQLVDRMVMRDSAAGGGLDESARPGLQIRRRLLVGIGLLPPESLSVQPSASPIKAEAALYDPRVRTLAVASDGSALAARGKLAIAHESAHALQDQRFPLDVMKLWGPDADDQTLAWRALVEGDATLMMVLWGRQFLSPEEKLSLARRELGDTAPASAASPPSDQEELRFPYEEGYQFVRALHGRGGFAAVDQAFGRPPTSTEQVMHPEKYLEGEAPRAVPPFRPLDALVADWRVVGTDTLGELTLRSLIDRFSSQAQGTAAAAGWGGDRYTVLEDETGRLVILVDTVWDAEADAAEFFNAFVPTVDRRFGGTQTRTLDHPSRIRWSTPQGPIEALHTRDRVSIVYGPNDEELNRVLAQLP